MKTLLYTALVLLFIVGCTSNKTISAADTPNKSVAIKNDTVRIANDSLEYEVIIIDPGFTSWLAGRTYPRNYY